MPIRLRSAIRRTIGCAIALLVVFIPLQALADEPLLAEAEAASSSALPQVVEPVEEVVEEVVEPTEEVVEEVVEPTEEVVDDVGDTTGAAVEVVEETTAEVVDQTPTVEETEEAAGNASGQVQENANAAVNDVSQNAGSATGAVAEDRPEAAAATGAAQTGGDKQPSDAKERRHDDRQDAERTTVASTGSAWRRMHFARLGVVVPATSFLYQPVMLAGGPADDPEVDPCEEDPGLACLGLLFGIGDFAEAGGDVLGLFIAATGVALRGLIVFAFALLFAGVVALSIAPRRAMNTRSG
jgi:hypothetical protein